MSSLKQMIRKVENESQGVASFRIHGLLEICKIITGRGSGGSSPTKSIDFDMGDITICCNSYYDQVSVISIEEVETELDRKEAHKLADELKKRILSFERKIRNKRNEVTEKVFDQPLDFISFDQ